MGFGPSRWAVAVLRGAAAVSDGEGDALGFGVHEPNDPEDILDTGALLPVDPPRRIAFYGCGCGDFGCGNVAGLITQRADHVEWSDFRSITGAYSSALPDPEDGPDPLGNEEEYGRGSRHALPNLRFATDRYLTVVRDAMGDRSWETRCRAVVRQVRLRRPETRLWATHDGEGVDINHRTGGGRWTSTELALPPGPTDRLADALVDLLDQGVDPRRIAGRRMWR